MGSRGNAAHWVQSRQLAYVQVIWHSPVHLSVISVSSCVVQHGQILPPGQLNAWVQEQSRRLVYFDVIWQSLPSVFIFRGVSCVVEPLGEIIPPTIDSVTHSSVTLSYEAPEGASSFKVIEYMIKYRKFGGRYWKLTTASTSLRQTVTGLDASTLYEFKVVARYRGERPTVESWGTAAKTKRGKCALLNNDNNNSLDNVYGAVIMTLSHYESYECTTSPDGCQPLDEADRLESWACL